MLLRTHEKLMEALMANMEDMEGATNAKNEIMGTVSHIFTIGLLCVIWIATNTALSGISQNLLC